MLEPLTFLRDEEHLGLYWSEYIQAAITLAHIDLLWTHSTKKTLASYLFTCRDIQEQI